MYQLYDGGYNYFCAKKVERQNHILMANPKLVVELSEVLQGDALTSMFYPYAENHINRCKQILQCQESKVVINPKGKIVKIYSGDSPTFKDDVAKWLK